MDLKRALKQQYLGGLAMLRQAVEKCPDDLWVAGEIPRQNWRIAYHAVFYTHLYLMQNEAAFEPWEQHVDEAGSMWEDAAQIEPYTKEEIVGYLDRVSAMVPATIDALDLDSEETGFHWYPNMTKLSHQLMNLRHLQGHVGQLSELLMARGIEIDWISGKTLA